MASSAHGPLVAVYPGTFDPITNGHTDIIRRAARQVDRLVIGVSVNAGKGPLFSIDERTELVREEVAALNNGSEENGNNGGSIGPPPRALGVIEVRSFDTLLVQFAAEVGASMIIRGLRAVSDFDYEFQMAGMNARLTRSIDTVFFMASDRYQFISSRFVKEIGRLGGDISPFVSPRIAERLSERFGQERLGAASARRKSR
jgi:pantetheine-phosphate adenylyltransferase